MDAFSDENYLAVRCDPGDDLLASIETALDDHGVRDGAVVSTVGTLSRLRVYYFHADELDRPREERRTRVDAAGNWEITNVDGVVADGEPHLHISASEGERTLGGHLLAGSTVSALAEVLIRRTSLPLTRERGPNDVSQLTRREE